MTDQPDVTDAIKLGHLGRTASVSQDDKLSSDLGKSVVAKGVALNAEGPCLGFR